MLMSCCTIFMVRLIMYTELLGFFLDSGLGVVG